MGKNLLAFNSNSVKSQAPKFTGKTETEILQSGRQALGDICEGEADFVMALLLTMSFPSVGSSYHALDRHSE